MARVAGYVHLAIGEFRVDFACHHDHLARDFLVWIGISRKIALDVAKIALYVEANTECVHGTHHFFRLEELQVLRRRVPSGRRPTGWGRGRLLRK